MNTHNKGKFVMSLDFELLWGVLDIENVEDYEKNIFGVWEAIPKILNLFDKFNVKGTFAVVGFLLASDKENLLEYIPKIKPNYKEDKFSPYTSKISIFLKEIYKNDLYFAEKLINLIKSRHSHEIATHTFSHYYCLEEGQSIAEFKADLESEISIAKSKNIEINSLVFPRNQYFKEHLAVLSELGISSFRGNESAWYYHSVKTEDDKKISLRISRLLDNYINLSGHNCYSFEEIKLQYPHNIASSKFLRPYSNKLKFLEAFRLKRIKNSMTHAAKNNKIYHLWWHPHNFGTNLNENLTFLKRILEHYKYLNDKYGYQSATMSDCSKEIMSHK